TLSAATDSRVYNGLAGSNAAPSATGIVAGDSISGLSQSFDSANAGSRTLSVNGGYVINDGTGGNNYNITLQTASGSISKAALSITANDTTRTYDATPNGNHSGVSYSGLVNGEGAGVLSGSLAFNTGSAHSARNAGNYTITPSGLTSGNYDISFGNGALTINKADLTLSAQTQTRTYNGSAASSLGPLTLGLGEGDFVNNLTQSFDSANAGSRTLSVNGGYTIFDGNNGNNYNVTLQTASGSISKAGLTATANNVNRTYDGTSNGNSSGVTITGMVGGEASSVVNQSNLAFDNGSTRNAGSYTLNASGLTAQNYDIAYTSGNLTVNKANATVTANSSNVTYNGQVQTVTGFTATDLVNGETAAVLTGITASGSGKNAGSYVSSASGTDGNYNLTFIDGSLNIAKANATVTANSATVTYNGQSQTVNGFSASGLVNGETETVLTGITASGSGKNAGSYVSSASGTDGNYNLTFIDGNLTINKASLTAAANNVNRTYDGTTSGNSSGVTITGMVGGESSSVVNQTSLAFSNGSTRNAGSYTLDASGLTAQNYDISYTAGNLTINKANLTLSAATDSRVYNGLAGSNAAPSATGIVAGDSISSLSQSFDSANAGNRTLSVNGGYVVNDQNGGNNYNLTLQTASGTISKAGLTATANNVTRTYDGTANGNSSGVTITGMVNNEASSVVNQSNLAFDNGSTRNAGSYVLNASGLTAQNYDIAYTAGNLTINKTNATLSAASDSRVYNGLAGSNAAPSATGIVAGDSFTASQSFDSANAGARTLSVNSGYAINDGNNGNNYNVTTQTASGSITPAALTVTANNDFRTYNGTNYSGGAGVSYSGFVNNETTTSLGGSLTYGGSAQGSRNAGTFNISASGLTANNGNYSISYVDGQLVTSKANATLIASSDSRVYNGFASSNAAPSAIGIVAGDSVNLSQAFDSANAGNRTLSISSYAINDGNGGNNYNVNLQSASGTITPANLTITANSANMLQGQTVPLLTASYLGLVGNDTASNFGTPAVLNTAGSSTSPQGSYAIIPSGASSPNYIVSYVNGQLTIHQRRFRL
ncbi:MAG: S-layer family protein, partial [Brachymonas sp.]|nr:S-layer family protein [Brachymonas sp.]